MIKILWKAKDLYRGLVLLLVLSAVRPAHIVVLKLLHISRQFWADHIEVLPPEHYIKIFCLNALLAIGALVFQKQIKQGLEKLAAWLNQEQYHRERQIIFAFCLMIFIVFMFKLHLGFWSRSQPAWTYEDRRESILLSDNKHDYVMNPSVPAFISAGLLKQNARYIEKSGIIFGPLMFLHFQNGEVLPANYELLNMSVADFLFQLPQGPTAQQVNPFVQIIRQSLDKRRHNTRFVLPLGWAYPNHVSYMPIDYSSYPPASDLRAITFWVTKLHLQTGKPLKILDARLIKEISIQ